MYLRIISPARIEVATLWHSLHKISIFLPFPLFQAPHPVCTIWATPFFILIPRANADPIALTSTLHIQRASIMWGSTFVNVLLLATSISAQRFDGQFWPCNPLKNATGACPPNRGLPTSTYSVDFTKQTSVPDDWTVSNYATVNFGSQGAEFTFNKRWDAPQLWTDFFILFGRVSIVARVANGTGMISSAVLVCSINLTLGVAVHACTC